MTALSGFLKHTYIFVLGDEELNRPQLKCIFFLSSVHIVDVRSVPSERESGNKNGTRHLRSENQLHTTLIIIKHNMFTDGAFYHL